MNPEVDHYFTDGCGRCPLGGTPECKVHNWTEQLRYLRNLILECGLTEELKWGVPCYTWKNKNILILAAFKDYCSISFFKGSLLQDTASLLDKPGENTQGARMLKFTELTEIAPLEPAIKAYIFEAIEIESAGLKVDYKQKEELVYPEELKVRLAADQALNAAFEALTPGRKRGYILHFNGAKQAKTRETRIEKCIPKILAGKGWME